MVSMSALPTHYEILGVSEQASSIEIKSAYRKRLLQIHPDAAPENASTANEKTQRLIEAYRLLSVPDKRCAYDADLSRERSAPPARMGPPPPSRSLFPDPRLLMRDLGFNCAVCGARDASLRVTPALYRVHRIAGFLSGDRVAVDRPGRAVVCRVCRRHGLLHAALLCAFSGSALFAGTVYLVGPEPLRRIWMDWMNWLRGWL